MVSVTPNTNRFKISRRGKKLNISDDQRTLLSLPKDVPERTWAEIFQRDEIDLIAFDVREELIENALAIVYSKYMERQTAAFTVHCATRAWLKLIDWQFYRHDPGEDPTAYPPCYIPNRAESWVPDDMPEPSLKDPWARHDLNVIECTQQETLQKWPSNSSLEFPVVEEIPKEYRFPGKVNLPMEMTQLPYIYETSGSDLSKSLQEDELVVGAESEVLQKVTNYSGAVSKIASSTRSSGTMRLTPLEGSLHGAGDSKVVKPKKREVNKSKSNTLEKRKFTSSSVGRSRGHLPPIGSSESHMSVISDCRLRSLRLDTHYEISSEKVDSPPGEVKRQSNVNGRR